MIIIKSVVTIDSCGEYIDVETDYSASAIEQCFENDGYCILADIKKNKEYMVTPKSVMLVKTDFGT